MENLKIIKFPAKKDLSQVDIPSFMTNPIVQPYEKQFKAELEIKPVLNRIAGMILYSAMFYMIYNILIAWLGGIR